MAEASLATPDDQNPFRMLLEWIHNKWVQGQPNQPNNPMVNPPPIFDNSPESLSNQQAFQNIFDMGGALNYQPGQRQSSMVEDRRAMSLDEHIQNLETLLQEDNWTMRGPGWLDAVKREYAAALRRKQWEDAFKVRPYRGNPFEMQGPEQVAPDFAPPVPVPATRPKGNR